MGIAPVEVTLCGTKYSLDNKAVFIGDKDDKVKLEFEGCDAKWCKTCANQGLGMVNHW